MSGWGRERQALAALKDVVAEVFSSRFALVGGIHRTARQAGPTPPLIPAARRRTAASHRVYPPDTSGTQSAGRTCRAAHRTGSARTPPASVGTGFAAPRYPAHRTRLPAMPPFSDRS